MEVNRYLKFTEIKKITLIFPVRNFFVIPVRNSFMDFFLEIRLLSALKADIECLESRYRANKMEIHL